jgi:hypothetical protein
MITRMKSGASLDSILITSAPYSAKIRPISTPTAPTPQSSTPRPRSGYLSSG